MYWTRKGGWSNGSGENYIMSLIICTPHPVLFIWSNQEEWDGQGVWHLWGIVEVYTRFWWGNLRERDHLEDPGVDGKIILRWIFRKWDVWAWTVLIWLRSGTGGVTCECSNEPSGSIKCGSFLTSWELVDFTGETLLLGVSKLWRGGIHLDVLFHVRCKIYLVMAKTCSR